MKTVPLRCAGAGHILVLGSLVALSDGGAVADVVFIMEPEANVETEDSAEAEPLEAAETGAATETGTATAAGWVACFCLEIVASIHSRSASCECG